MYKKIILAAVAFLSVTFVQAQEKKEEAKDGFGFTTVKANPITSIKDQYRSGTCWDFASLSFMESEIMRKGKPETDLSEMFIVYWTYVDKARKYVNTDGHVNLAQGGAFSDYILVLKKYGIVPESVMPGLNYGEEKHVHYELEAMVKGIAGAAVKNPNKKLSPAWKNALRGVLDAYLGESPEEFEYNGVKYTPKSYAESLDFNPDNYVSISSFQDYPWYSQFAIEVADNWTWDMSYNVPADEMMEIIENAIMNGYTVLWASDVSEEGFKKSGVAMCPTSKIEDMSGSDRDHWTGIDETKRKDMISAMKEPVPEIAEVTDQMRMDSFNNKTTTDDHGMHLYGIAKDKNGKKYFMVKNSWGDYGNYHGTWYFSETFVKYKTMDLMVHKNAIPKEIRKKLNIK